jgi:hypothetical protein
MGNALNLVEDSLQPSHEAGGDSPHVTYNMTTLTYRVCPGVKFSKFTQYDMPLDPEPVTPSPTKNSMQHEVTFVSGPGRMFEVIDILESKDDETKEVKPRYAKHSNLNGQHRGYARIC